MLKEGLFSIAVLLLAQGGCEPVLAPEAEEEVLTPIDPSKPASSLDLEFSLEHSDRINSVEFSADGNQVVTASEDKSAKLWDTNTGELLFTVNGHLSGVTSAKFIAGDTQVVTMSTDETAKVWSVETGKLLYSFGRCKEGETAFSPDGTRIATVSDNKSVRVFASNGRLLYTLSGHSQQIRNVAFSEDSKEIVTSSDDNTSKTWAVQNGQLRASVEGKALAARAESIKHSRDGKSTVTISNNTVKLFKSR
jgi:hypothetical protein